MTTGKAVTPTHAIVDKLKASRTLHLCLAIIFVFPYYAFLITGGSFELLNDSVSDEVLSGLVFNSTLSHLLNGDFTVDPDVVGREAFLRGGKTYTYFGIAPALLRVFLLPLQNFAALDMTALSIVIATGVSAYFKCASVLVIKSSAGDHPLPSIVYGVLITAILVGGPQIQFLKPSAYQEVICWAMALNAAFVYCAVRGLLLPVGFSARLLCSMALLAGIALLTRVTTGVGLYLAISLLLLSFAARAGTPQLQRPGPTTISAEFDWPISRKAVGVLLILGSFAVLCGIVNNGRWGNPLVFADLHRHVMMVGDRIAPIDQYGEFNIRRVFYALFYYFLPINFLYRSDGKFVFDEFQRTYYDTVELPPSSMLLTDPLIIFLAGWGFWIFLREPRIPGLDVRHATALLIGFAAPALLILSYSYAAFRFRGEFYALFEFAAFLALYALGRSPSVASAKSRQRFRSAVICMAIAGMAGSHIALAAYVTSPLGRPEPFLERGWIAAYFGPLVGLIQ